MKSLPELALIKSDDAIELTLTDDHMERLLDPNGGLPNTLCVNTAPGGGQAPALTIARPATPGLGYVLRETPEGFAVGVPHDHLDEEIDLPDGLHRLTCLSPSPHTIRASFAEILRALEAGSPKAFSGAETPAAPTPVALSQNVGVYATRIAFSRASRPDKVHANIRIKAADAVRLGLDPGARYDFRQAGYGALFLVRRKAGEGGVKFSLEGGVYKGRFSAPFLAVDDLFQGSSNLRRLAVGSLSSSGYGVCISVTDLVDYPTAPPKAPVQNRIVSDRLALDKVVFSVRIERSLRQRFADICAARGLSQAAVISSLLGDYVVQQRAA